MPNIDINRKVVLSGVNLLPETKSWLAVLPSRPSTPYIIAINTFIKTLIADGNWNELDRLWVFAQEILAYGFISLPNPTSTQITAPTVTPTFTANQGLAGNGATMYVTTNYTPSIDGVKWTQNSASFGLYTRTAQAASSEIIMGSYNGVSLGSFMTPRFTGDSSLYVVNSATNQTTANTVTQGLFATSRAAAGAEKMWRNGVNLATSAQASVAVSDKPLFILAWNNNGVASNFSTNQTSMAFIGSGAIDQLKLYTAFQTFATTIGFNV